MLFVNFSVREWSSNEFNTCKMPLQHFQKVHLETWYGSLNHSTWKVASNDYLYFMHINN